MKRKTSRKQKANSLTVVARFKGKEQEAAFAKEFQKMIRKCDHLLDGGMSFELITTKDGRYNHQEE